MKKFNINTLIFLLVGIIVGLSVALVAVLVFRNDKETVIIDDSNGTTNTAKNNIENQKGIDETKEIKNTNDTTDPVQYFTSISNSNDKGTIKQGFIKVVDFLFYDEPINGKRFSELKDEAKIRIMKVALTIDSKIDSYFPGYKETISNGDKKIYTNVKTRIVELYIKITTKICTNNRDLCENAKEDFESLKKSFGITLDFLKNLGKEELNKLKEWYADFRE